MLKENETVLHFNCSTKTMFLGCTVEVLVNSRTYDDIKSFNNTCHHKDGMCQPDRCACSVECNEFAWNTTVQSDSINNTFGCGSRLYENGNTYKAKTSLKWNGDDFITIPQVLDIINVRPPTTVPDPNTSQKGNKTNLVSKSKIFKQAFHKLESWVLAWPKKS
ncbi:Hypothetical predicted protein [Mytilus galloprovincialis]|uniref:Uncharacterized protein n=1 Tax=Mytilus galloprovincialis TaxID=29158 RepID=A0A8B6HQX0_MYTGA|nr:Hypothetical predicted protein [Mytilus galloprovincialis]